MTNTLDDGSLGAKALGKFLDGFRTTVEKDSADMPKEVFQLLAVCLREFDKSTEGPVWMELQSDETVKNAWLDFDDKFNDYVAAYDDVPDPTKLRPDADEKEDMKRSIVTLRSALTKRGF